MSAWVKKWQEKKYHTVGTVPKSNKIIVEIDKIGTSNTHIHECSNSRLSTGISLRNGGIKLVLFVHTSHFFYITSTYTSYQNVQNFVKTYYVFLSCEKIQLGIIASKNNYRITCSICIKRFNGENLNDFISTGYVFIVFMIKLSQNLP